MSCPFAETGETPFVLSCINCDCDSPNCYDEALATGWTEIQFAPDSPAENYLGLCPICTAKWNAPGRSEGDDSEIPSIEEEQNDASS